MIEQFITWFRETVYPRESKPTVDLRQTGKHVRPPVKRTAAPKRPAAPRKPLRPAPHKNSDQVEFERETGGSIEDAGPGKNVFVRSKYIREDAGTHDSLKIIGEDSLAVDEDDGGIDPYNTGQFDRSKNWNGRNRK